MEFEFSGSLGDKRNERRAEALAQGMWQANSCVIQQAFTERAAQRAAYRLLTNEHLSEETLINRLGQKCAARATGKTVLCLQDTTEINLDRHRGRINRPAGGYGSLDNAYSIGFKVHLTLAVEAATCQPLGIAGVRIWTRDPDGPDKHERRYHEQSIAQKESGRWAAEAIKATQVLACAEQLIFIQDREGDIFSQFLQVPNRDRGKDGSQSPRCDLLIRSLHNRTTAEGAKIHGLLAGAAALGRRRVYVPGNKARGTAGRLACLTLRAVRTVVSAPVRDRASKDRTVALSVVEAVELNAPAGVKALRWVLLTTLDVGSFEDAVQMVEWYRWRWTIERFFGIVKGECFDVEGSELERAGAIRKLMLIVMELSVQVLGMQQAWKAQDEGAEALAVFDEGQLRSLSLIEPSLSGGSVKQRNGYQPGTLLWATWIVARLGGWKGNMGGHPPGPQTLLRGLDKFHQRHLVYQEFKDVGTQ